MITTVCIRVLETPVWGGVGKGVEGESIISIFRIMLVTNKNKIQVRVKSCNFHSF